MSIITSYTEPSEQVWSDSMFKTGLAKDAVKNWKTVPNENLNNNILPIRNSHIVEYGILNEKVVVSGVVQTVTESLPPNNELTALITLPYLIKTGTTGTSTLQDIKVGYAIDQAGPSQQTTFQYVLGDNGTIYWFSYQGTPPFGDLSCFIYAEGIIDGETTPALLPTP